MALKASDIEPDPAGTAPVATGRETGIRLTDSQTLLLTELGLVIPLAVVTESPLMLPAYATAAVVWRLKFLYERRFALSLLDDLGPLALGGVAALVPALLLGVGLLGTTLTAPLAAAAAMFCTALVARAVAYSIILERRRRGAVHYPTLIIGAGPVAVSLARRIQEHPECGLRPVGFLERGEHVEPTHLPLLGTADDLAEVVRQGHVTDVVIGYGGMPTSELVELLRACDRLDVEIHVLPRLFEMHRMTDGSDHVWGVPLVRVRRRAHRTLTWRLKRYLDVCLAGAALLALAPLLAATAIAVRLELGRGLFFEQVRVGLDGRPFTIRKFRSMRSLPEGVESPWSVKSEDRIGPVGRFIRRYSIDELPQLFNVLTGDMSLVGPRPERPEYVEQFLSEVPRYGDRHRVPVGLTGLAAVHGLRGDTSIDERAYFDNVYIENWSLWMDLKILARTAKAVVRGTGG